VGEISGLILTWIAGWVKKIYINFTNQEFLRLSGEIRDT
jgi:hypothetical protein